MYARHGGIMSPTNVRAWVGTCYGYCLKQDKQRGPLCRSCGEVGQEERGR